MTKLKNLLLKSNSRMIAHFYRPSSESQRVFEQTQRNYMRMNKYLNNPNRGL